MVWCVIILNEARETRQLFGELHDAVRACAVAKVQLEQIAAIAQVAQVDVDHVIRNFLGFHQPSVDVENTDILDSFIGPNAQSLDRKSVV